MKCSNEMKCWEPRTQTRILIRTLDMLKILIPLQLQINLGLTLGIVVSNSLSHHLETSDGTSQKGGEESSFT